MNGWTNYETWNVALWINNEEAYYNLSRRCKNYDQWASRMDLIYGMIATPDGVAFNDPKLDLNELDECIVENV
jgi:hypothetical protein